MAGSKRAHLPAGAAREQARSLASDALALLARATNHDNDPQIPYRYGEREQRQLLALMHELADLIESGQIVDLRRRCCESDRGFQRFLRRVVAPD
jgi:hypothetical protein